MHHAPIENACRPIKSTAQAPPAIASPRRSRGASTKLSPIAAAKNAMPSTGIGTPSGWAHAEARTVSQPDSAQNVALAPR